MLIVQPITAPHDADGAPRVGYMIYRGSDFLGFVDSTLEEAGISLARSALLRLLRITPGAYRDAARSRIVTIHV